MRPAALCAALLILGARAGAQVIDAEPARIVASSPLDRRITVHLRDVAMREALDRIALLADIRISYSGDNLPLDRRVSISRDTAPVSQLLAEILVAHGVEPRVVGTDHIVLVPRLAGLRDSLPVSVAMLDRVVVTGNVLAGPERELPIALDVVPGRAVERRAETALSQVLSGAVPGVWLWEHTPTSVLARYGSIRGASSFGLSFPKVYIDGIEVANPLLLTQISPEVVERIEVIRGPQGAALYGSDAISGVVNVVSRHDGAAPDGSRSTLRSSLGFATSAFRRPDGVSASSFSGGTVPVQDHALTVRLGSNLRSAGFTIGGSTSGQYVPEAYSRELRGLADARIIGSTSTLTASARLYGKNAGVPTSPLLAALDPDEIDTDSKPQQLRMYSIGSTGTFSPSPYWTYSLTAGVDGYSLRNVSIEQSAIPSVADSVLRNASGSAMRGTMRASVLTRRGSPDRLGVTMMFSLEESLLQDETGSRYAQTPGLLRPALRWSTSTGMIAQSNLAIVDAVFLTAGVRRERLGQTTGASRFATLPMLGAALARGDGDFVWKLRGAYGKGIRAAHSPIHVATREPRRTVHNPDLEPEEQAGIEAGADVTLWRRVALHVTRFDQLASGLIQTVTITDPDNSGPGSRRSWYQLQNVGEISNRGWESQASLSLGHASLSGAAAFVDSRVRRVATNYSGDLRAGDRMLGVPARTLSGTADWTAGVFSASVTVSRASDWINYDRLSIASELIAADGDATTLTGDQLRRFWASYPGATRLRGALSLGGWRNMVFTVTGDNLLNIQRGEPDTITIVPGRTITAGVRAKF